MDVIPDFYFRIEMFTIQFYGIHSNMNQNFSSIFCFQSYCMASRKLNNDFSITRSADDIVFRIDCNSLTVSSQA